LDRWIVQSGLQSNLVDWVVIDNPKPKSDVDCQSGIFDFILYPKNHNNFIKKLKFQSALCSNNEEQLI